MKARRAQRASPSAPTLFVPAAEGPSSPLSKACTTTLRWAPGSVFATPRAARQPGADVRPASARQRRSSAREGGHVGWPKAVARRPEYDLCSLSSGPGLWLGHLTTQQRPLALPAPAPVRFQPDQVSAFNRIRCPQWPECAAAIKVGRCVRFSKVDLDAYIAARRVKAMR
jgi:hypothetical protein